MNSLHTGKRLFVVFWRVCPFKHLVSVVIDGHWFSLEQITVEHCPASMPSQAVTIQSQGFASVTTEETFDNESEKSLKDCYLCHVWCVQTNAHQRRASEAIW